MIISGHQPNFLPYPGFFNKMSNCDIFVLGDSLQFTNKEWQNRNRIIFSHKVEYLTVPVKRKFPMQIKDVLIADPKWFIKPMRKLRLVYGDRLLLNELEHIFLEHKMGLINLNVALIKWVREKLKINTKMIYLSDLSLCSNLNASERIIQIVKTLNGTKYLAGIGSKVYLNENLFEQNGIEILWNDWEPKDEKDKLSILQRFLDGCFEL